MEDPSFTGAPQVPYEVSLPILCKDHDELKTHEELGKVWIEDPVSDKEGGHSFLINRKHFFRIEAVLDKLQDPRVAHKNGLGAREGFPEDFEGGQGKNKIAQGTLVNHQHR